jgi:RNA polymerase sigma-70 factor (ECF subfamily)
MGKANGRERRTRRKSNQEYVRVVQKALGDRTEARLKEDLERLALYCQPPDPGAKNAPDLIEAMKRFTWWPQESLLERIEYGVLTVALTQRKYPERRLWKNFELVNRRKRKLQLLKRLNDLVGRARERFTKHNFSDLEALESARRDDKDVQKLLRDIDRIREDVGAAKTIDWTQYKTALARFSDDGSAARASDTGIACYARVLEIIVDHRRWGKLRKESEALVYWLLKIGHPEIGKFEFFNRGAAFRWIFDEQRRIQQESAAKWARVQQSGRVTKKTKEDIEDDRLMALVLQDKGDALVTLRKRHAGLVRKAVREILKGSSDVDEITQRVFVQVWKAAPEYVPAGRFSAWLTRIAKNLAINEWKRARAEKERIEFAHVGEDVSTEANQGGSRGGDTDEKGEKRAVLQALSQLSPSERRILEARHGLGGSKRKDRQALADELGISPGEVENLECGALEKMRQLVST